jgi:hypothetical protein
LQLLKQEAEAVALGKSGWAPYLKRLVGGTAYHARLAELAVEAQSFCYPDPKNLDRRFCSLVGFAEFCCSLPDWPEAGFYRLDSSTIKGNGW